MNVIRRKRRDISRQSIRKTKLETTETLGVRRTAHHSHHPSFSPSVDEHFRFREYSLSLSARADCVIQQQQQQQQHVPKNSNPIITLSAAAAAAAAVVIIL